MFGQPIKSSLSPVIQRTFAQQFGLEIEFKRIETGADGFGEALESFRLKGGLGCNITLPLKRCAWQLAVDASPDASRAQAANTLVAQPSSGWFAHNTDGAGLVVDLTGNQGLNLAGLRILVLGAGGAATGIMASLLAENPWQVVLVNRDLARALAVAKRFESLGTIGVTSWADLSEQGGFDLVINATSMGQHGEAPPLEPTLFAPGAVCYDLNYNKAGQPLKKLCEEMGQGYIDGLGMLVEQAAKSFYIWTGKQPDTCGVIDACKRDIG